MQLVETKMYSMCKIQADFWTLCGKKKKEKPECKIYLPSSSPKSKHLHLNQDKWQVRECAACLELDIWSSQQLLKETLIS